MPATATATPPPLIEEVTKPDGRHGLKYNFHAGQLRAWQSKKRFILVLAGTQGGKTSWGPLWVHREIQLRGAGDYMVVTPTYPLLNLKALPEFLALFERRLGLGRYTSQSRTFTYHDGSVRVIFGHASDPESLESATAKAIWCDEAGQNNFKLGSWEALQRRLSIHQGRAIITTTPYSLGWLKQRLWDPWQASGRTHPDIDVISFESIANPAFPREEFERARRELPRWKFDLFFRARFTRPAGQIYDCFEPDRNTCPRFAIPDAWPRYLGLDFGGTNTCGVFFAEEMASVAGPPRRGKPPLPDVPTGRLFAYRVYGPCGSRTAKEHVAELLKGEPRIPTSIGGAASEDQWRAEFRSAGLPVREPPIKEVEVGINRVYGAVQCNNLVLFSDLEGLIDEFGSYSREVDEAGNVLEDIENKEDFHRLDATRYALAYLKGGKLPAGSWGLERL